MKQCPICDLGFSDEYIYCLNDGTVLLPVEEDAAPTVSLASVDRETVVLRYDPAQRATEKSDRSKWLSLMIGLMAATIIALVLAFYYVNFTGGAKQLKDAKETPSNTPIAGNENASRNSNVTSVDSQVVLSTDPAGKWAGDFSYPSNSKYAGTVYSVQLALADSESGRFHGRLVWTLQHTNDPEKMDATSTEFVAGIFDKLTRKFSMNGYDSDDPKDKKIVSRYDLALTDDDHFLSGTVTGEKTPRKLDLKRVSE
jgi:hypothetical protein